VYIYYYTPRAVCICNSGKGIYNSRINLTVIFAEIFRKVKFFYGNLKFSLIIREATMKIYFTNANYHGMIWNDLKSQKWGEKDPMICGYMACFAEC